MTESMFDAIMKLLKKLQDDVNEVKEQTREFKPYPAKERYDFNGQDYELKS